LNQETNGNTEQGKYEASQYRLNRIQAWFNGLLVLFTAALVGVGAWQARRLRQTVEATKEAANAARDNAMVLIKQSGPYLRVTHFRLYEPQVGEAPEEAGVIIAFANRGRGNAFVTNTQLTIAPLSKLPDAPPYDPKIVSRLNGLTIIPEAATPDIKYPFPPAARTLQAVATLQANGVHVFVYGFQDYEDVFEQVHRFGFAYQFDGKFFDIVGGPAYNYHRIEKKQN